MTRDPAWLLECRGDVHSQTGEDGVVEKILETLPEKNKWCVEFGAWDGMHLSNTRNLIEGASYSAVLVEGNRNRCRELRKNYSSSSNVIGINAFVGWNEADNLDALLADIPIPFDFDFLSIDVDGNDYHIWKAISQYRPKVICIEFNPTVPTEVPFVQPADPSVNQGASLLALVELGKTKGYELIVVLPFNAFFVDNKYFPLFGIPDNRPGTLRRDLSAITYLFSGYDGTMFLHGYKRLPWHSIPISESKIQRLPKFLRKYPANYSVIEKMAFGLFLSPRRLLKNIWQRFTHRRT